MKKLPNLQSSFSSPKKYSSNEKYNKIVENRLFKIALLEIVLVHIPCPRRNPWRSK